MRIAVMGAGAVGCYFGALLHRAGHEVVLVGRQGLVDAVRARGLRLQAEGIDELLPLQADTSPAAVAHAGLVLFCVKSGDTEIAGASMAPFLAPDCILLNMQNGVDNATRLSKVLGRETVPVAVYVAVGMAAPGHVVHYGRCELVLGPMTGSDAAASLLNAAGIPSSVTPLVHDALWTKLAINCAYNALSALTQVPYGELVRRPGILPTMHGVVEECRAVAKAVGVSLPDSLHDDTVAISRTMAGQLSSTARDVARGRRSEIDFINGYVVREGERLGIATPLNRLLHSLVRVKDDALPADAQSSPAPSPGAAR
jgi:2-dehydropantoate 2-reductase